MPRISPALSEIIKRSLFRIREHLECLSSVDLDTHAENLAMATYELAQELGIPAVHSSPTTAADYHLADALRNLTSMIDFDLTGLDYKGDPEDIVKASRELMSAVHTIPLPSQPPARTA